MTFLPKTLSRDLKALIHPGMTETEILDELKKDPKNLFKFVRQIQQCVSCLINKKFIIQINEAMREAVMNKSLSLALITPSMRLMQLGFFHSCLIAPDLYFNERKVCFSRLLMMRECTKLRDKWMAEPDRLPLASDFVYCITLEQAQELHRTMLTHEFYLFQKESLENIQRYIVQSITWGYERGVIELQKLIIDYVFDYSEILGVYLFAVEHELDLLISHCDAVISNFEYFESINDKGERTLIYFDFFWNSASNSIEAENKAFKQTRLNSFLSYSGDVKSAVLIRTIMFTFQKEGVVTVGQKYVDSCEYTKFKSQFQNLRKVRMKKDEIRQITSDGQNKIADLTLAGIVRYFTLCYNVILNNYADVGAPLEFISKARIELICLGLNGEKIEARALLKIPEYFPDLQILNLRNSTITGTVFYTILNSNITAFSCTGSSIELSEIMPNISQLTILGLSHVKTLSKADLKRVLNETTKLRSLFVVDTANFSLDLISHPEHLEEIAISSHQLEPFFSDSNSLIPFPKLKCVTINGVLSPDMKRFVITRMRERSDIKFQFFSS